MAGRCGAGRDPILPCLRQSRRIRSEKALILTRILRPIRSNSMNRFTIQDLRFRNKVLILVLTSGFLLLISTLLVHAQEAFVGPGGCTTKEECRAYCDEDVNKEECLTFAVNNDLMSQEEADRARKFLNETGPGGCKGEECRTYCEDVSHREECLNFAVEKGFIGREEAERMRKFAAIESEGGPGGCKREECSAYCEDESHHEECFKFAKEKGLIDEEEIEKFEVGLKIKEKIKSSGGPGGCTSERECHQYCSDASHIEECAVFGAEHTGKSPDEVRRMIEEFKNNKDGFRGPEGFEDRRQEFEERARGMREEFEQRKDVQDGQFEERRQKYEERFKKEFQGQGEFPGQREFPGQQNFPREGISPEEMKRMMGRPEDERMPYDNFRPLMENAPAPAENQTQYENQYPNMMQPSEEGYQQPDTYTTPPSEPDSTGSPQAAPQPTSYDRSKSFIANVISAFLTPFRD